jgi:cytidyltransferase-like protein
MIPEKIKSLDELAEIIAELKKQGKKIVHCHGCFDLTHYGHSLHFLDAKKQGDILIVTVTPDEFIEKGPGRPFFNQDIRLKQLSCLEPIDYVALNKWPMAVETIKILKPDIYVKGKEVENNKNIDEITNPTESKEKISNLSLEIEAVRSVGGEIYLTDQITFSSSSLINQITSAIPDESKEFLNNFRKKYSAESIIEVLKPLKSVRVLIIGDAVLDEYVFCKSLDKSGKEPIISYKFVKSEIHAGGVFALANHISNFSDNVSILTCIGNNTYEFTENSLNALIERNLFVQMESRTVTKRRYIDDYKLNKLFSIYNTDELIINPYTEQKILNYLEKNLLRFDMVIIMDYGQGIMTPKIIKYLCNSDKFLAINCQLNAGNLGYNFITKYSRADFVSMNEKELRLPFQERTSSINVPILKLSNQLKLNKINITLGKSGIMYYENGNFFNSPSFTKEPLDTIGSGDAVLALTSLLAYKSSDPELIPFLGNCVGGLATRIIGNRRSISEIELKKFASYILK